MSEVIPTFQMIAIFVVIIVALALYMVERIAIELTSLGVIAVLLVFFHFFPVSGADGVNLLGAARILQGFANPALVAVLALLVIGQGLVRTGALDRAAQVVFRIGGRGWRPVALVLITVLIVSAFLNNIPVVVIFIPIMQALAQRLGRATSNLMIPLSFAAILGGMTTLIGSSTNLLVSSELVEVGEAPFGFFDFTVPGLVLASAGFLYVVLVAPKLLPKRTAAYDASADGSGRHFLAQFTVTEKSKLIGERAIAGLFRSMPEMTVRMIQRNADVFLPPFEDVTVRAGDLFVVAATRDALTDALKADPGLLRPDARNARGHGESQDDAHRAARQIAEAMVTPDSRLIGQTLRQARFDSMFRSTVLGIRRQSRMLRAQVTRIPLEPGDVLLIEGRKDDVRALRSDPDLLLMEWSATDLPSTYYAPRATLVFLGVVIFAASGFLPIVIAAVCGAGIMVACGALSARQAAHALDRKVVMVIAASLALGAALQETGGAAYLADSLLAAFHGASAPVVLSAFFLLVAVLSNLISTKACAVLFTPIAVSIGRGLGVDPMAFAVAVVFAANCSFASPIGYQTNLLVMTPGQYRFVDFVRVGSPLIVLVWVVFSLFAPWYFGLW